VLAELAATVPAFHVAEEGHLPPFGAPIDKPEPALAVSSFSDAWTRPRGLKGDRPGEPGPKGGKNA
jgi:hypothetical protein